MPIVIKVTPRDAQVIDLLVQGCDNKEMGKELGLTERTIKQHLRHLYDRAGIGGRMDKRIKLALGVMRKEIVWN